MRKRSDGKGALRDGVRGLRTLSVLLCGAAILGGLSGCELTGTLEEQVAPELPYTPADLTEAALAKRMEQIDEAYAEPRNPTKVQLSYETALDSISHVNGYEALWRGARACAWIALNAPASSQRKEYAIKGIEMGREAIKPTTTSTKVESWYYLALCLAGLADVEGTASRDQVRLMRDRMAKARALDPSYDHCGPDRFLGQLKIETADRPTWAVGTFDEGLGHLKAAAEKCPDFGENHLAYANALIKADEPTQARRALERVLACPKPDDYSAEHESWLQEATQLLTDLTPIE